MIQFILCIFKYIYIFLNFKKINKNKYYVKNILINFFYIIHKNIYEKYIIIEKKWRFFKNNDLLAVKKDLKYKEIYL